MSNKYDDAEVRWNLSEANARIAHLQAERDRLRDFIRNVADNYDCDEDAHTYNTGCRVCDARAILDKKGGE